MAIFISKETMESYDLSCPKCGSLNNLRIAGVYENKSRPERWFCHCATCGKSFKPRKKGEKEVASIMDTAKQKLPKELLGKRLADGITQQAIGDDCDVPFWAVSKLKKEYWPDGFKPEDYKEDEDVNEPKEGGIQVENCVAVHSEPKVEELDPIYDEAATQLEPASNELKEGPANTMNIHDLLKLRDEYKARLAWIDKKFAEIIVEVPRDQAI
ncbi:MAG TPA: hypothetical protein DEF34_03250 [Desulfotomaculum sp.]|nr:MAG: hypothetical protein JL56_02870 [Desulfotomaculum sp. BICA1-6]HBX22644.1 hypothetical protein [Desulfotomaculum sp.]